MLCCTPSYALHIAQGLREAGIAPDDLNLEVGMFGAEPWTEGMRERLESELGLTALNIYGLSEIVGPGVLRRVPEARDGLHVQEDHFLVEVIDPDTGERRPGREDGELVFTTLTKEALPLLRYRTGDIASLTRERCACGRTFARMSAVRGRRDDMLIIRGVNLYPSQIEHVLLEQPGVAPHYQLVVERPGTLDEVTVCCEPVEAGSNRSRSRQDRAGDPRADRRHRHRRRQGAGRGPAQRGQGRAGDRPALTSRLTRRSRPGVRRASARTTPLAIVFRQNRGDADAGEVRVLPGDDQRFEASLRTSAATRPPSATRAAGSRARTARGSAARA